MPQWIVFSSLLKLSFLKFCAFRAVYRNRSCNFTGNNNEARLVFFEKTPVRKKKILNITL